MCFTFKKNNKQTKKSVYRFLQDGASASIRSLQTSTEIKCCQSPWNGKISRIKSTKSYKNIQNQKLPKVSNVQKSTTQQQLDVDHKAFNSKGNYGPKTEANIPVSEKELKFQLQYSQ